MWLLKLKLYAAALASLCLGGPRLRASPDALWQWSFEPMTVAALTLPLLLYALGLYRLSREGNRGKLPGRRAIALFLFGMGLLFLALCSPIETVADNLFSMHMAQHIILMMGAPPLFVLSEPGLVLAAAFPDGVRKQAARIWRGAGLDRLLGFLMHPIMVWVLFTGAFVFWHLPQPYAWGLDYRTVHLAEHASFFVTALAFWTLIIEPSGERRLGYAASLLYLTVTIMVGDLPGALMVLSPRALYPLHEAGAASFGLTALEDQQLAGLIMWIPAGAIYLAAAIWLFTRMLAASEHKTLQVSRSASTAFAVLLLPLLIGGCGSETSKAASNVGGDPDSGVKLIGKYGCGACHTIPGISGAKGLVGPPLNQIAQRVYIAGVLQNTPDNMVVWLRDPQKIVPHNAMPNMGIDEKEARDITAYLYTLD